MTVDKERVQLLIDALRSGGFEQGKGRLLRDGRFCCLGVACVVAQHSGLLLRTEVDDDYDVHFGDPDNWGADANYSMLPRSVQDWYGFEDQDPELEDDDGDLTPASTWNDEYDKDFAWIADAFERTFLTGENNGQ
jgi:hypothetical protein